MAHCSFTPVLFSVYPPTLLHISSVSTERHPTMKRKVERPNVDAEFQGIRRYDAKNFTRHESALNVPSCFERVSRKIRDQKPAYFDE